VTTLGPWTRTQLVHLLKNMICRAAIVARIGAPSLTFDGKFASAKGPQRWPT
jgi:hypothetical protein